MKIILMDEENETSKVRNNNHMIIDKRCGCIVHIRDTGSYYSGYSEQKTVAYCNEHKEMYNKIIELSKQLNNFEQVARANFVKQMNNKK